MLQSKRTFFTVLTSLLILSCVENKNAKLIVGKWAATEWLVGSKPSDYDIAHTSFSFDSTGKYTFLYGTNREEGTYKVENEMLFTTPKNEKEIMVKIEKLTGDSLVFGMNRGGQNEQMTLKRVGSGE